MIGLFGISASGALSDKNVREPILGRMVSRIDKLDFSFHIEHMPHASIGIVYRNHGANKDITLRNIQNKRIIAFNGYARLEKGGYQWSADMVDHLSTLDEVEIKKNLLSLSGSFECIICSHEKFLLISDRFGSKRLFYARLYEENFIFSPEMGMIVNAGIGPKEKDVPSAIQFLTSGFFIGDDTLDKNIKRFPFATVYEQRFHQPYKADFRRYWIPELPISKAKTINGDILSRFTEALDRSITGLLPLSTSIMIPLSGGLDSRAIACFLTSKTPPSSLSALTYDMQDEVKVAKLVSEQLQFKKHMTIRKAHLGVSKFREFLFNMIHEHYSHCVLNQYFYTYFFKDILKDQMTYDAIYDGIYLGLLFSAPYTYQDFNHNHFKKIYCRGAETLTKFSSMINTKHIDEASRISYQNVLDNVGVSDQMDGVSKSTLFYIAGRLRRYVSETYHSRENYGYVLKPGFDYDLVDFGYHLDLSVRKGKLYCEMFKNSFPSVFKIKHKDSYGNRERTVYEKLKMKYVSSRIKLNSVSKGRFPYFSYQIEYFFYALKEIDKLRPHFFNESYIPELFSDKDILQLFETAKEKPYLLNFLQRVLMVQSFFKRFDY